MAKSPSDRDQTPLPFAASSPPPDAPPSLDFKPPKDGLSRRNFLLQAGSLGLAASLPFGLLQASCNPPAISPDGSTSDATPDVTPEKALPPAKVTKPPYLQITGAAAFRLRLETPPGPPLTVRLLQGDTLVSSQETKVSQTEITHEWPFSPELEVDHRDSPGTYALHEATFSALASDQKYRWEVKLGGDAILEGNFRSSPPKGAAFRLGWIADTMFPNSADVIKLLDNEAADLALHGGDIQYQTNPFDTWSGFLHTSAPLFRKAPMHFCVGNHEVEGQNEYEVFFQRLFGGQGDAHSQTKAGYHAFTYAGIRFLLLDTQDELELADAPQVLWLKDQFAKAKASAEIRFCVAAFHKPTHTFSRASPERRKRAILHPLFVQYKVPLVLMGHNHCYERFEHDGITYIMDGGGGALLYKINEHKGEIETEYPQDIPLRIVASEAYGCSVFDFQADGSIKGRRLQKDKIADEYTIKSLS